jgi:hypothetical protein
MSSEQKHNEDDISVPDFNVVSVRTVEELEKLVEQTETVFKNLVHDADLLTVTALVLSSRGKLT